MSYCFHVSTSTPPALQAVLARIDATDVTSANTEEELARWPHSTINLCLRNRSTRPVSVFFEPGRIEIRTNILSSPDDYRLALQLTVAFAEHSQSLPSSEATEPMPITEFLAAFDENWIASANVSALRTLRALISQHNTVSITGPHRECHIGPRVLESIGPADDEASVGQLLAILRKVQWIHLHGYDAASDFILKNTDIHLAFWYPQKPMLLPSVQWICVDDGPNVLTFPFARLSDVLGRPLNFIDENQPLIESVSDEDMPALLSRARLAQQKIPSASPAPAPPPIANPPPAPKKPWWKIF